MTKNLVIVESPAKAKTIKKFLGPNYEVMASNGHVRDLPKSQMGIDIEHDYEPKYITIRGKGELLAKLRKEVKKADKVFLATDPDREGEAISWHLSFALNLADKNYSRITFNEITKNAVKGAIKQGREIDMNLVDAQQARRVLDRMVGYSISPLLWKKIKRGLSAGRVQSVALRLICDREKEIDSFIPEEYWTLDATLQVNGDKKPLDAKFIGNGKKIPLSSEKQVDELIAALSSEKFVVQEVRKSERMRQSPLPFTTSTLQQEAAKELNFPTAKTMRIAQQLYEGVDVKGHGTVGLITYLRTDSTRVSEEAQQAAQDFILSTYSEEYLQKTERVVKNGVKIQDAHEAIRPTYVDLTPASVKDSLQRDQFRLYQLIWKRFMASRMAAARMEITTVRIGAGAYTFGASASKVVFDGYTAVYTSEEDRGENNTLSASLVQGMELKLLTFDKKQHFTQPAPHFTEASLVKTLEELGIGRPSTYAPTISTIISRRYVTKEARNLFVTELGEAVNNMHVCSAVSAFFVKEPDANN